MTTFSALMGAVPIAIGMGGMTAQSRIPLGLVIIGGLDRLPNPDPLSHACAVFIFRKSSRTLFIKNALITKIE